MTALRRHRIVIEYTAPADPEHLEITHQIACLLYAELRTGIPAVPDATDLRVYDEVAPLPPPTVRAPQ